MSTVVTATHHDVLEAVVREISGDQRPGQLAMADAVADALDNGRHLLVQAGTGTGKSLGYLAPVLIWLASHPGKRIVIATATLALQRQLATNDIPAALAAVEQLTGRRLVTAIVKGRTNYACRLRAAADDGGGQTLIPLTDLAPLKASASPESALGAEVLALRSWVAEQHDASGLADRDDAPAHTERGWQQVSIPVRECLGVQRCPYGSSCFVERSREQARAADLVVTNHALLAINALHGGTALPEHAAVIIDEAHELVARVTGAASAELSPALVERVGRRAMSYLPDELALELLESIESVRSALDASPPQRVEDPGAALPLVCAELRSVTRRVVTALTSGDPKPEPEQRQAAAAVKEVLEVAERIAGLAPTDVVWVTQSERFGPEARVAPLSVAALMRSAVFQRRTTVLTSATLKIGGDFTGLATSVGLLPSERDDTERATTAPPPASDSAGPAGEGDLPVAWRGLDVGSPFDYRRQGILYVARDLPAPGREGLSPPALAEVAELVWASGGRTLGLFSSRRAAEAAAGYVRKQLPDLPVLCQGDAQLSELTRRFIEEDTASLFGTLSLWQGVDVPGATCQLVVIDRIPFPRPDDPITLARQRAVVAAGGNGFLAVPASQAALLLAQGAGRLIRRLTDRGVVAVLDSRLATARYGGFLRSSMPPLWETTDREVAIAALRRLAEAGRHPGG